MLRIWGIHLVSLDEVIKSSLTLVLLAILIVVLLIVYGFFFKGNQTGYNKEGGNRAQPKL
ncbi:hypothetical protein LZQ00_03970 [Sphingobacterium sp. SRCM116780]|uniref:hypothetical protein n=1 Tax=Sphingobacterium sp. SRCM116780 TaxID=2907623 RepID=UPI001F2FE610|nr:hypothetical protein [Sphingobacterium sp. SRCM116780]UIR56978.1 hypothetical protein LZQ00_03970 [Sphingobacterium sp. SRCM116780]